VSSEHRLEGRLLVALGLVLLIGLLGVLASHTAQRQIDQDETVHLNAAYFVTQGETLYGSFFENYPPLMVALLQPVVRASAEPAGMIRGGRWMMFVLAVSIVAVTGWFARPLGGWNTALLAGVLLLSQKFYLQKAMEVRPDVPALLLLVLALPLLRRAACSDGRGSPIAAGALLCLSGLFTPKVVFAAAGATLAACFVAGRRASPGRWGERWGAAARRLGLVTAGAGGVAALAAAELARRGMLAGFFADAVDASLRLSVENPSAFRAFYLETTFTTNAAGWALAVVGLVTLLRRPRKFPAGCPEILAWSMAGGFAGLFLIEAPMRQVFLAFLPQTAVAGAVGLAALVRAMPRHWPRTAGVAVSAAALFAATVPPVVALRAEAPPMLPQLEIMNRVREITAPGDRVLDCWTGLYLTRLPAYRYFYLNSDVQRMVTPAVLERDLLRVLDDRRVKLVIADEDCSRLPSAVRRVVRRDFAPDPDFPFLLRRR
jgi:hypothetical protein